MNIIKFKNVNDCGEIEVNVYTKKEHHGHLTFVGDTELDNLISLIFKNNSDFKVIINGECIEGLTINSLRKYKKVLEEVNRANSHSIGRR